MDSVAAAALRSWGLSPAVITLLLIAATVYTRGYLRLRRLLPEHFSSNQLLCFWGALLLLLIALESPLDAFSSLLLQAHMVQHLLLMMVIPPVLLLANPMLPLLRGLPRSWVTQGLAPFLRWPALRSIAAVITHPVATWFLFNLCVVLWHVPRLYEVTLRSPAWHDLEHGMFFWTAMLFWWPVVRPWPSAVRWPRWSIIPYLLTADLVNTAVSATFVFADKVLYPTYAAAPLSAISPREDQTTAGVIMWVPGSIFYLLPSVFIAMRIFGGGSAVRRRPATAAGLIQLGTAHAAGPPPGRFDLLRLPLIGQLLRFRYARPMLQVFTLAVATAVIADGFLGPEMAPMNLAGLIPWVHSRGLLIVCLLAIGNLFCLGCPFMLPRAIAKRVFPAKYRWPRRLRSKWLAVILVAAYLWAYEALDLWNKPAITAWIVIGYFVAAFVVDAFFRDASFCKYVCPLGQFNFVTSLVSPFEVKIRESKVCKSCGTYDCIRGNSRQKGCELHLFQPRKAGNVDCTFCLDCIHACPHDNVSILPVAPAGTLIPDPYRSSVGRLSKRIDIAALCGVVVFGAWVNALAMLLVFQTWETRFVDTWGKPAFIAAFCAVALIALPLLVVGVCARLSLGRQPGDTGSLRAVAATFVPALVPLGAAMWAAHFEFHTFTAFWGIVPGTQRAAGELFGNTRPVDWSWSAQALLPDWIIPVQLGLLDAGVLLTLYISWRITRERFGSGASALRTFLPWGVLALALYAAGAWIVFQPMSMRGMMMN